MEAKQAALLEASRLLEEAVVLIAAGAGRDSPLTSPN